MPWSDIGQIVFLFRRLLVLQRLSFALCRTIYRHPCSVKAYCHYWVYHALPVVQMEQPLTTFLIHLAKPSGFVACGFSPRHLTLT